MLLETLAENVRDLAGFHEVMDIYYLILISSSLMMWVFKINILKKKDYITLLLNQHIPSNSIMLVNKFYKKNINRSLP